MAEQQELSGPDLAQGIEIEKLKEGELIEGHLGEEPILLVRRGAKLTAVGARCTHYGAPLRDGLLVGDTVRCPWHHACFNLRTGDAERAPALDPIACYATEQRNGRVYIGGRLEQVRTRNTKIDRTQPDPSVIAIVGAGAAGNAAAELLRREGYTGRILLLDSESERPVDRPNLSKDYLAGQAPDEWAFLRPPEFYRNQGIELRLESAVRKIDPQGHTIELKRGELERGEVIRYDRLLLATGAEPVKLSVPGANDSRVRTLRSIGDSRAIIARAERGKRAVIVGASFIGLEVAASLRARGLDVAVVAPDGHPLERVLGPEVGQFVQSLHEAHGVRFHLGRSVAAIEPSEVMLDDQKRLAADLVVVGIGVRPRVALAEAARLAVDGGILVDATLQTSVPDVFAAGDVASFLDPRLDSHPERHLRVEHFVVAERQGQIAARNMLGEGVRYADVPFFWSAHYDLSMRYVGYPGSWDRAELHGRLAERDCTVAYRLSGHTRAVATIGRDRTSLQAELAFEQADEPVLAEFGRTR